ncbi:metalloregulator ArsR/SmtB family transcription factor [Sagittula stellata]|uniref:Transcriptional regulator/arsenate reductase n=1 Tax=Sagittula stellata (strain ATCC 700073 / DSM 11524 / E-37) TaxID=388399 RepID=A3K101_SAGS3|nr:metalloregulator ArsR/SmtB family transcription factor [Sagittula stellata]EBA09466.1 transcriptional regulator/arsenate reductase [Sagittula stellata E-37]
MESVDQIHLAQLTALAHPKRLSLFRLLMRRYPDRVPAGDLAETLGMPPSSLSAALAQLRQAGLVTQERQGTSLLYAADTGGSGRLVNFLVADCCRGRGDICFNLSEKDVLMTVHKTRKWNVLFICTGNSARSIFAETLLREMAGDRFEVFSAGTRPQSELNPQAVALLESKGHDVSPLRSKTISEFKGEGAPKMDFVFTVCDTAANEECPPWPGQPMSGHWGQPDPVKATGTKAERRLAFQQVYGALKNRIAAFAALPVETLDRAALQARIDNIGRAVGDAA